MLIAWRVTKLRHVPYDGTGARLHGARWNAPGRPVIYAADSYAGAILEILAHALRPRTLPGRHHGIRIEIPDDVVTRLEARAVPGWDERESPAARAAGERWLEDTRSAALIVPALPARPHGHNVLINPHHPDAKRIIVSRPFPVPWDERFF